MKEKGHRPLTQAAERRAKELEVWNQIRRTEEEPMEMGTMEKSLLQVHCGSADGFVRILRTLGNADV